MPGGSRLLGGYGGCRELRVGEPVDDDLSDETGVREAVRENGQGIGHACRVRRVSQHCEGVPAGSTARASGVTGSQQLCRWRP